VKEPKNFRVPMGTPISLLMKLAGVDETKIKKVVIGGPMMGKTTYDLNTPVTKAVSGVLFFSEEACMEREERDCISCGICVQKCPAGLMPSRLAILAQKKKIDESIAYGVNDCMECGCCAYSCPASIKIVQWIKLAKDIVRAEIRKRSCPR
jgi:electron transport complex protein RnfC